MSSEFFKDYYKKLAKEGFIKALLLALTVGFTVLFVSATALWFINAKLVWICPIAFAVVVAGLTSVLYLKKYKPDQKYVAKRVDELGLEERMLTMLELEGQTSFIAVRQREDAISTLKTVNASFIRLAITLPLIIAVAISAVLGLGMTTVAALSATDSIPTGTEIVNPDKPEDLQEFEVIYEIYDGEGEILGLDSDEGAFQIVVQGNDASPVIAIAAEGWFFVGWSDGPTDPVRQELNVQERLEIFAIFAEADEEGSGESGDDSGDGDQGPDKPNEGGQSDSSSNDRKPGRPGGAAGGKYEPNNKVINGEIYYGDIFDDALDMALEDINGDGSLTQEEKDIINSYIDSIRK